MHFHTLAILGACSLAIAVARPAGAQTTADLAQLIADAARYQSGESAAPLHKLEDLVRESVGKPALRAELEAELAKLLVSGASFEARRFACQWLTVVGTDASLPALAELLKSDQTAGIACLALGGRRSPKTAEILRNALPSAQGAARLAILGALANQQDAESVAALVPCTRDADAAVADAAILALAKIGGSAARETIASLRKEARPEHAGAVSEATLLVAERLAAAGDGTAAAAIYQDLLRPETPANIRRGALAALLALDADGGQQRIQNTLSGGDPALAPVAIARVAALKSPGASETFAALLPGLAPAAREWMIEALASRGDDAARRAIRGELAASDAGVRRAAVRAVGRLEDGSAAAPLASLLAGAKSPEELLDAELALAHLRGGAATDEALVAELQRASGDAKIRLFAVLARRGAQGAVPALLTEAGGSDAATVRAAFQTLGRLAAAADAPAVLERLVSLKAVEARADAETGAARALARIADASHRSAAVRGVLAKASDLDARCSLLRLLPNAADSDALGALEAAAADAEPTVRDAAVRALAAWPDATGWNALLAIFRRPENETHRALALRALVRLAGALNAKPDAALVERYRELLAGARGDDDRKLILSALAGAAHPDALQLAVPLASQAGVRAEAELAVKKIAAAVAAEHPQAAQAALEQIKAAKP